MSRAPAPLHQPARTSCPLTAFAVTSRHTLRLDLALLHCLALLLCIAGLVLLLRVRGCHVLDSLLEACDLVLKLQPLLRGYIQRVQVVLDFLL